MHGECHCDHHTHKTPSQNNTVNHIIELLTNNFISPYKVLFLLDPKQADHFKSRNESSGCCSSNHITIKDDQLTRTEKYLKELMSYSSLLGDLDAFLRACQERFTNIIESGKKDKLEVTDQVQKFILDKVMSESINGHLYTKLAKRIKEESMSNNREIGLWATPATWYQKYPLVALNFLSGEQISSLLNKGCTLLQRYIPNPKELLRELTLMEKDGKFEASKWLPDNKAKILNNPEKYIEIKTSGGKYLFEELREVVIRMSSIPFELNAKANLFCTVSPNLHIIYSKSQFTSQKTTGELKYTLIINIGQDITLTLEDQSLPIPSSSLFLLASSKSFSLSSKGQLFLLMNYIGCVQKK